MKRILLYGLLIVVVGCLVTLSILYWMGTRDLPALTSGDMHRATGETTSQRIERGRYLAQIGHCMGCHTVPGGQAYAGGRAIPTPFGTLYGPNITPDGQSGIGSWNADDFWAALHNGKGKDGRLLYPAFPYTEYTRVSRADADALFAYLRTVAPSDLPNRDHALAFPYDQPALLAVWRALYFEPGELPVEGEQSAQWNRGRYLVEGLGHCAACHAPRNHLGATNPNDGLSGGMIDGLNWYAPALTNDSVNGLGKWSAQDIATLLRAGVAPHSSASGPMAEVVAGSSQYLSEADARAIGVYLKTLPAMSADPVRAVTPPSPATLEIGAKLYRQHCAQCHQDQGQGSGLAWPPLAGNPTVTAPSPINTIRIVLDGGFAPATAANPRPHGMPPFGPLLGDADIAALVTYIRFSWDNRASAVTAYDVKRVRDAVMR